MTVRELIEKLEEFEDNWEVVTIYDGPDTFQYLPINNIQIHDDTVVLEE